MILVNAESALIHPWRSCSCPLPSLGAHHPVTCIDCTEIPTDFAHREGIIGSIGQAICETVGFVPDVPCFRFMPAITLSVRRSDRHSLELPDRQNLPQAGGSQPVNLIRCFTRIASCNMHLSGFNGHNHRKHSLPIAVARIVICVTTDGSRKLRMIL